MTYECNQWALGTGGHKAGSLGLGILDRRLGCSNGGWKRVHEFKMAPTIIPFETLGTGVTDLNCFCFGLVTGFKSSSYLDSGG